MSLVLSKNISDTPVPSVPDLQVACPALNYSADYAVVTNDGSAAELVNLTAPSEVAEKITIQRTGVANVYTNTGIDPNYQSPSKRGQSVVFKVKSIYSVTDTVDAGYRVNVPVQAHVVVKVPDNPMVTDQVVLDAIKRLVSTIFDTGKTDTSRLIRVLRGSLVPTDLS